MCFCVHADSNRHEFSKFLYGRILLYITGMNNIYFIMIVRVMIHRSFTVRRKNLYSKTSLIIYIIDLRSNNL